MSEGKESRAANTNQGVQVKRVPLAVLALIIGATACQEFATSPNKGSDPNVEYRLSNPPPPPIDTGAAFGFTGLQTNVVQSFPSGVLGSVQIDPSHIGVRNSLSLNGPFIVPVTYMLNADGSSGYLHFHDAPDIDADANGMVKLDNTGFSGKGFVTFNTDAGPLVVDLSSVLQSSSFAGCGGLFTAAPLSSAAARPDSFCFQVTFGNATLNGDPVGPVFVTAACYARPENNFCNEEIG
jgi:hypothetical protein